MNLHPTSQSRLMEYVVVVGALLLTYATMYHCPGWLVALVLLLWGVSVSFVQMAQDRANGRGRR